MIRNHPTPLLLDALTADDLGAMPEPWRAQIAASSLPIKLPSSPHIIITARPETLRALSPQFPIIFMGKWSPELGAAYPLDASASATQWQHALETQSARAQVQQDCWDASLDVFKSLLQQIFLVQLRHCLATQAHHEIAELADATQDAIALPAKHYPLQWQPVDMRGLLKEIFADDAALHIHGGLPMLSADAYWLRRAVLAAHHSMLQESTAGIELHCYGGADQLHIHWVERGADVAQSLREIPPVALTLPFEPVELGADFWAHRNPNCVRLQFARSAMEAFGGSLLVQPLQGKIAGLMVRLPARAIRNVG